MKIFFILLVAMQLSFGQEFQINAHKWYLLGTAQDVNVTSLNVNNDDILWRYSANQWQYYQKNSTSSTYTNFEQLKGGDGFWIYPASDYNLSIPDATKVEKELQVGWNLCSLANADVNLSQNNNYSNANIIWTHRNFHWQYYLNSSQNQQNQIDTLTVGEGFWIYYSNIFSVGLTKTNLSDGIFNKVTKSSSDSIEDIWNISFKIETASVADFDIAIKIVKDSGAVAEVIYKKVSISNNQINPPNSIDIEGIKTDGTNGATFFDDSYDPQNARGNSIILENNILTLKLGTVITKQTVVSTTTFKATGEYNITIVPTKIGVIGGSEKTVSDLMNSSVKYSGVGMSGSIELKN